MNIPPLPHAGQCLLAAVFACALTHTGCAPTALSDQLTTQFLESLVEEASVMAETDVPTAPLSSITVRLDPRSPLTGGPISVALGFDLGRVLYTYQWNNKTDWLVYRGATHSIRRVLRQAGEVGSDGVPLVCDEHGDVSWNEPVAACETPPWQQGGNWEDLVAFAIADIGPDFAQSPQRTIVLKARGWKWGCRWHLELGTVEGCRGRIARYVLDEGGPRLE